MKRLLFLVSTLVLCLSAWANDSAVQGVSGTIAPMAQHASIRMVSEKVDAKVGWETATVRCEFVFKNEGKATTVKMGFPEESWGDVGPIKRPAFKSFKSWVDGKPAKMRFVPSEGEQESGAEYHAWHVKEVPFAAGQTRIVVDEYTAPLGEDTTGGRFFNYILKTGRNWKGTIGKAEITVDTSVPSAFFRVKPSPTGYVRRAGKLIWMLRGFEPKDDVRVQLDPPKVLLNGFRLVLRDPEGFVKNHVYMAPAFSLTTTSANPKAKEYAISGSNHELLVKAGAKEAVLDEARDVELPRAPYIDENNRLIIPIVAVVKLLGGSVVWDSANKTVKMTTK